VHIVAVCCYFCSMIKFFSAVCISLITTGANAQYYYNDIISTTQSNTQYVALRQSGFTKVIAVSKEHGLMDIELAKDIYSLEQNLSKDKNTTTTKSVHAGMLSYAISNYKNDMLATSVDSSELNVNRTTYTYENGKVKTLINNNIDKALNMQLTEVHEWFYNEAGKPIKMLKIKDGTDTTLVNFVLDEKGNVAEEKWYRRKSLTENYYYYYDAQNRLTDIVRYNLRFKKLLPDYMFEYDVNNRVSQMTQVLPRSGNYLIWKYNYNNKALKLRDLCYDKTKKLVGRVDYTYE